MSLNNTIAIKVLKTVNSKNIHQTSDHLEVSFPPLILAFAANTYQAIVAITEKAKTSQAP